MAFVNSRQQGSVDQTKKLNFMNPKTHNLNVLLQDFKSKAEAAIYSLNSSQSLLEVHVHELENYVRQKNTSLCNK